MGIDRNAIEKMMEESKVKTERSLLKLYRACFADDKELTGVTKKNKNRANRRAAIKEFSKWSGYWPTVDDLIRILRVELDQAEKDEIADDLQQMRVPASRLLRPPGRLR